MAKSGSGKNEGSGEKTGAGLRLLGRGCLYFTLAALMFTLGVLTGRGTAPVRFDMDRLEERLAGLSAAAVPDGTETAAEEPVAPAELEFYDALKKSEDLRRPIRVKKAFPKKMKKKIPSRKKGAEVAGKASTGKKKPARVETAPERPPAKKAPSGKKAVSGRSEPAKASAPGSAGGKGRYSLQVAALKERSVADKLAAKLAGKGYAAYTVRTQVAGKGTWYRVRVGAYASRADAQGTLGRLKGEGIDAFLVNR